MLFLPSGGRPHLGLRLRRPGQGQERGAGQEGQERQVARGLESPAYRPDLPRSGSLESGFTALGINVGVQLFRWLYVQQLASQVQNGLKTGSVNISAAPMPCRVRLSCHPRLRRLRCKRCKACGLTPRRGVFTTDKRSLTSKTVL